MERSIAAALAGNPYPGRGLLCGRSADGTRALAAYFITGRSAASRGRILARTEDGAATRAPVSLPPRTTAMRSERKISAPMQRNCEACPKRFSNTFSTITLVPSATQHMAIICACISVGNPG